MRTSTKGGRQSRACSCIAPDPAPVARHEAGDVTEPHHNWRPLYFDHFKGGAMKQVCGTAPEDLRRDLEKAHRILE